jgi:hypothetical protein
MAAVTVRLTNKGGGEPHLDRTPAGNQLGFEGLSYFTGEFFWVLATDASADRYYAVKTVGGIAYRFCICSLIHTMVSKDTLPPGGQVRLFALLAAPPDAPTIDLQAPASADPSATCHSADRPATPGRQLCGSYGSVMCRMVRSGPIRPHPSRR